MKKFYKDGLRFHCTGCGNCCTGAEGYVELSTEEANQISKYLKISEAEFLESYLQFSEDGNTLLLSSHPNGDCIFLRENQCTIYPVRPLQCQTFSFWPENLKGAARWQSLSAECPGIGWGN